MKLIVGNLPPNTHGDELRHLFSAFGTVTRVEIVEPYRPNDHYGLLHLYAPTLSAQHIAERIGRTTWKQHQLDVFEPVGLPTQTAGANG